MKAVLLARGLGRRMKQGAAAALTPTQAAAAAAGAKGMMPVGNPWYDQRLVLLEKDSAGRVASRDLLPVRFVPLLRGER